MTNDPRAPSNTLLNFDDTIIKLVVGPDEHESYVNRVHLQANSEYFRIALEKDWKEGQRRTLVVDDVQPDVLRHYLHFLLTSKLAGPEPNREKIRANAKAAIPESSGSDVTALGSPIDKRSEV